MKLVIPYEVEESLIWKFNELMIQSFAIESFEDSDSKLQLSLWLPASEWNKNDRERLLTVLKCLVEPFGKTVKDPIWGKVSDEDWSLSWKKYWKPCPIGKKLLILPSWIDLSEEFSTRNVLRLDPGAAFGTGEHPTTKLCLEAMESHSLLGLRIADIGCGSGILGLAALSLGAKEVFAVDIDPLAISSARENAFLNNVASEEFKVELGSIDSLEKQLKGLKSDLLFCNILAPTIKEMVSDFQRVISSAGHAFFSGLLVDQIEDITSTLAENGWQSIATYEQEKWALIHASRTANQASN